MSAETQVPGSTAGASLHVRFGAFTFDARQRRLERHGLPVELAPKQFDALHLLIENAGDLVGKEVFHARLWPQSVVSETSLNKYIWQVRRILGESEDTATFIETVPKLGYRFIAAVQPVGAAGAEAGAVPGITGSIDAASDPAVVQMPESSVAVSAEHLPSSSARAKLLWATIAVLLVLAAVAGALWLYRTPSSPRVSAPITSIAVLPFKPLVADDRDPITELGIADSLIGKLSSSRRLVVRSIGAVRRYDALDQDPIAAGRALGVGAVLEGHLHKRGDTTHLTARLLAVADGTAL